MKNFKYFSYKLIRLVAHFCAHKFSETDCRVCSGDNGDKATNMPNR